MSPKLSGPMLAPLSGGAPKQLMILLHGYGADGGDLISLGRAWGQIWPDMAFIAPNAPNVCARNASGFEWFALSGAPIREGIASTALARPVIVAFLEDIWAQTGLAAADTVLAGFSQGAMMALHVGTSLEAELAGIVGFSGAFYPPEGFGGAGLAKPPVALIHGELDPVVEPALSEEAAQLLAANGFEVALHVSPGAGHTIAADGVDFATAFVRKILG